MTAALAIAVVELKRFVRDKGNIFFVFVLPLMLVFVIGSQFGGGEGGGSGSVTISGSASDLRAALSTQLEDGGLDVEYAEHDEMLEQVARGRSSAGIVLDEEAVAAYDSAQAADIEVIAGSGANSAAVSQQIQVAVSALDLREKQLEALRAAGASEAEAEAALEQAQQQTSSPTMLVTDVDEIAQEFRGLGRFDLGASSQILLFTFLTSLAGAATLINARKTGVMGRTLAAPTNTLQVILGQAFGRWVIAFFQGAYIMLAASLIFRVDWGSIALSLLILAAFSLVAAGAAMVLGSALDNEGAAAGAGVGIGLVFAAIGGAMVPMELFPETMRSVAHVTPHAWAYDAFAEVQRHDGSLLDILPMLGVLIGMSAVLLALGSWLLRRSIARSL